MDEAPGVGGGMNVYRVWGEGVVPESGTDQTAGRHQGSWQIHIYPSLRWGKLRLRFSWGNVKGEKAVTGLLMEGLKLYPEGMKGAETGQNSGGPRPGVPAALGVTWRL